MIPTTRSRTLRQTMPEAQRRLWRRLRDRRFAGYTFRREHPLGHYALDFYCAGAKISLEIDGGQHGFPNQQARDLEKEHYLLSRGILTKTVLELVGQTGTGNGQSESLAFALGTCATSEQRAGGGPCALAHLANARTRRRRASSPKSHAAETGMS